MADAVAEPRFVAPNDKPTDCVVESRDGTRWNVHMARLAGARFVSAADADRPAASSVFSDMSDLGNGVREPGAEPIKLDEPSELIDVFLAAIYGTLSPDALAQKVRSRLMRSI